MEYYNVRNSSGKFAKISTREKVMVGALSMVVITLLITLGAVKIADWFNFHEVVFTRPVKVSFHQPVEVKTRGKEMLQPVVVIEYPDEIDTPIEIAICDKWGKFNCQVALAIASAESNMNCEAMNVNDNKTVDYGLFQINSIHWEKFGGLKNLVSCEQQIDAAYALWEEQGWNPWVVYQNGSFLGAL